MTKESFKGNLYGILYGGIRIDVEKHEVIMRYIDQKLKKKDFTFNIIKINPYIKSHGTLTIVFLQ